MSFSFSYDITASIYQMLLILWILTEIIGIAIIPRLSRRGIVIQKRDKESALLIFLVIIVSLVLVNYLAINQIAMLPEWVFYIGIVLMLLGIILRQCSMAVLGRFFSGSLGTKRPYVVETGSGELPLKSWTNYWWGSFMEKLCRSK